MVLKGDIMEEKEYNVVVLENGIEYTEVDRLDYNNNTYVFLANLDKDDDYCVRKLVVENNEEYIVGLDSKEEFDSVFDLFGKKNLS